MKSMRPDTATADDLAATAWHACTLDEVAGQLATDPIRGLAAAEAARRRAVHGANALTEPPAEPAWWKFLRQFQELMTWILLAAAGIAGAMGDWADAAAIAAIVLVNAIISFLQEERALQALAALQRMSAPLAKVVRDGELHAIPARELVPGDRIELEAGDNVPADARLIDGYGLRVQESSLTGESLPVEKGPVDRLPQRPQDSGRPWLFQQSRPAAGDPDLGPAPGDGRHTALRPVGLRSRRRTWIGLAARNRAVAGAGDDHRGAEVFFYTSPMTMLRTVCPSPRVEAARLSHAIGWKQALSFIC